MKYYIADVSCNNKDYKIGISSSSDWDMSNSELKDLIKNFLLNMGESIVDEILLNNIHDTNEAEYNILKYAIENTH